MASRWERARVVSGELPREVSAWKQGERWLRRRAVDDVSGA
jgi:hypothetical protein